MGIDVLGGLLDEKLIKVLSLFMKYPDKKFSLSEVSHMSGVNNATTFRLLNKLVKENMIRAIAVGKVRNYQLASNERVNVLGRLLKKEESIDALSLFCDRLKDNPRIKTVILDAREDKSARVIIVVEYSSKERIERVVDDIFREYGFKVDFVELSLQQYKDLRKFGTISGSKRILFTRA